MSRRVRVGADEARRIALAAQGFDRERPAASPDARHFRRVMQTLGLLQLDFVNVLIPAHFLIMWSRLGAYDRSRFEQFIYGNKTYTEHWAHEASIVPTSAWPLLEHRRAAWTPYKNNPILRMRSRQEYLADVLNKVREEGALTAGELPPAPGPKRNPGDWHRSIPRSALDIHFGRGELAVQSRRPNFQRVYDLPERVVPRQYLQQRISAGDSRRELLRQSADALGVATLHDLADYYRMSARDAAPHIDELIDSGDIQAVSVEGWSEPAYLSANARIPRSIEGASLLSPFDPVVWFRPRATRVFDFHYRIEIYVPEAQRKWGYYVLPFRLGDRIVARVDLKADRQSGHLLVKHAYAEDGTNNEEVATALADELASLSRWLKLNKVVVRRHNAFAKTLGKRI